MELRDLSQPLSVEELVAYQREVRDRQADLNTQYDNVAFPDEARSEFVGLTKIDKEIEDRVSELRARQDILGRYAEDPRKVEKAEDDILRSQPKASLRELDIFDLSNIRTNFGDPASGVRELRDRAMRAIDLAPLRAESKEHVESMLANEDSALAREVGMRVMLTGNPTYKRAWAKSLSGKALDSAELNALNRAASLTTTAGGFAVPYDLDPSVILTSNGVVNPMRRISKVITTTVDTWQGISTAGLSSTYGYTQEATQASDNTATIAQPSISTERAQAFVPFSIEIGMDWANFSGEMATLFQDAKDTVEGTAFITGSGTWAPQGVLIGGTAYVETAGTAAFVVADLYSLEEALPPRFRPRAQFIANRFTYNKVRQFDTGGGASLWMYLGVGLNNEAGGNTGSQLIGYPANEASNMSASLAAGTTIACIGDFQHYVIVDRIGMSIELLPHLIGSSYRPTGQRGLFAFWRNGGGVTTALAFRRLVTLA